MPLAVHEFEIHPKSAGERVDQFLARRNPEMSRAYLQKLIDEGHTTVDGMTCRRSHRLRAGEVVELRVPETKPCDIVAEDIPLDIAYEDADLLVVNKPVGMVVHPTTHDLSGTLVHALLHYCDDLSGINGVERPGIVHRIDKDTSGLLLVAKNDVTHRHLSDQFREHSVERLYIALVYGGAPAPSEGTITTTIARDPRDRKRMASVSSGHGKHAITHYRVAEDYGPVAMVECSLDTGRTHQIRVHLSEMGHPLVADPRYGGIKQRWLPGDPKLKVLLKPLRGQMLHAATLGFIHPKTDAYVKLQCPPPPLMLGVIKTLRSSARMDPDAEGPWDRLESEPFGQRNVLVPDYERNSY
jgi:23S rRNA pseudouridine1911/1915/1917 synthase